MRGQAPTRRGPPIRAALALLAALAAWPALCAEEARMVTVEPEETDHILANPGMGWETFHHTRTSDPSLPDWVPSTVHYARWGWGTLEPQPGKLDTTFLDRVLAESRKAGQRLAFRVMCCSTNPKRPYHPEWLAEVGGRVVETRRGDGPAVRVPDLDHPVVLERHLDFIRRLGARYDGHPDLDHLDLGSVGWWGEWHMSGSADLAVPSAATQKRIVDAYLEAFPRTRLLMLIGGGPMLTYAAEHGAGWRADCLGDMGGFSKSWCHMRKGYPTWIRQAGVGEAWKTAPVAWESCWDMRRWVQEGWPLRFIFNYALALHGSYLNNKSAPLPEGEAVRAELERFLRRLGYRLVLKRLRHPAQVAPGEPLELTMEWQNAGSAPCYRPYRVAYRLAREGGEDRVLGGGLTVEGWLPGSVELFTEEFYEGRWELPRGEVVEVADRLVVPADLPPGTYRLAVGVVGEETTEPVVRLGIQGRDASGWYPLSTLEVRK
ncbi:MAG: DUF4832 domain-containing protein [Candidatus Brocadiia bacterium]